MQLIFHSHNDAQWISKHLSGKGILGKLDRRLFRGKRVSNITIAYISQFEHAIQESFQQFIKQKMRDNWILTILQKDFYYLEDEKFHIHSIVLELIKGKRPELLHLIDPTDEEKVLNDMFQTFFDPEHQVVVFDSFVTFRRKGYMDFLKRCCEIAIDEYKLEQEYQVYLHSLREYVKKNETILQDVRLYFDKKVIFYREDYTQLTKQELVDCIDRRFIFHPIYSDSSILAPLLSIVPKRIILYTDQPDSEYVRVIQSIFEERVEIREQHRFLEEKVLQSRKNA